MSARNTAAAGALTLLYVEDDEVSVLLMQSICALRPGCELLVARDGAQALALTASQRIQVLLCDMRLPDMTGEALLPALRQAGLPASVVTVLVTAEAPQEAAELAQAAGFDGHWSKPLDVPATLAALALWQAQAGG